jgi:predicted nuclease of predicted toxin-antitoxin system
LILFDENIEEYWIQLSKKSGIDYISIRENAFGISDEEVILTALQNKALLVTEDKDFGNLVFSHGYQGVSVLLIRYDKPNYNLIEKVFLEIITNYSHLDNPKFMVLTGKKLRVRQL